MKTEQKQAKLEYKLDALIRILIHKGIITQEELDFEISKHYYYQKKKRWK